MGFRVQFSIPGGGQLIGRDWWYSTSFAIFFFILNKRCPAHLSESKPSDTSPTDIGKFLLDGGTPVGQKKVQPKRLLIPIAAQATS